MDNQVSASPYASALRQWLGRPVWPTVAASVTLIAAYASAVALALTGVIPLWAAAPVTFICAHAGFAIAHEACHRSISGSAKGLGWLDWVLGSIHCWMLFYEFAAFRVLHLRHHANTNLSDNDPDYWMQRHGVLEVALRSLLIPVHYGNLFVRMVLRGEASARDTAVCMISAGAVLAVMAVGLVVAPLETVVLWLGPAAAASSLINVAHRMMHRNESSRDHRRTTRIIVGDAVWEWLMCPFFWLNNHHLIHHESPRLPAIAHKAVFAEIEPDLVAGGAEIVRLGRRADKKVPIAAGGPV
jgi:beta-carotene hydroxylase